MPESAQAREKRLQRCRNRYRSRPAEYKESAQEWRAKHPGAIAKLAKDWRGKNPGYMRVWHSERRSGLRGPYGPQDGPDWQERNRQDHLEKKRKSTNDTRRALMLEALEHYGGSPPCCYCCGESEILLLGLDHIDGGGNQHRKETKMNRTYEWAKKNGWPAIFRVACHSCNLGSHLNGGICPHQRRP